MEEKAVDKSRLQYVDVARGIAMVCIVLGHLGIWSVNKVVFTFHVPVFFLITGYFTGSKLTIKKFIKNKARTLLLPYAVTCMVIIILSTIKGALSADAITPLKYWSIAALYGAGDGGWCPFGIGAIGAIWFLWASFWGSIFLRISLEFNKYVRIIFVFALFGAAYFTRSVFFLPFSLQPGAMATLFMYIGYLWKEIKPAADKLSKEVKCFGILAALGIWIFFIKDFKSFWLVNGDIGRGLIDILGCLFACLVFIRISKIVDRKTGILGRFFAYLGKYSLLMLCIHITEDNVFPWWKAAEKLVGVGMPVDYMWAFVIMGKLVLVIGLTIILSKIGFVRVIMGYKKTIR